MSGFKGHQGKMHAMTTTRKTQRVIGAVILAYLVSVVGAVLLGAAFSSAHAATVISVHDGDTFLVSDGGREYKVRLWGVDAPELGQAGCADALDATRQALTGVEFTIVTHGMSYGRTVGQTVFRDGDLSEILLRKGVVMLDERYTKKPAYREAQAFAKSNKLGVWSTDGATPPWLWRKKFTSRGKVCR